MANYYREIVRQKEMTLNIMKVGFNATYGIPLVGFEEAAGVYKEIQAMQAEVEYYRKKADEFDEEHPTEEGEENG